MDEGKGSKVGNLALSPKGGKEVAQFPADAEPKFFAPYQRSGVQVPNDTWSPSRDVMSIEDLNNCEGFV
jgi:hypothetical protein